MKAGIVRLYLCLAYYFAISVFIVVSFLINILSFLLCLIPGRRMLKAPVRTVLQTLFRAWAWFMGVIRVLDLRTPGVLPKKSSGGEIWVMNHPSILDGSYLMKFITNGTCIYKDQIGSNPLYGSTAKLAGHIPNKGGPDMIRMACEALERGEDLIIFPEGTRSTHLNFDLFKSGFALVARRSQAKVNILWMESPDDFMTREVPFARVPKLTAHVEISQIGVVNPGDYKSVTEIVEAVKTCYAEAKK